MKEIRIFRLGLYNSADYSLTVCYVSDEQFERVEAILQL